MRILAALGGDIPLDGKVLTEEGVNVFLAQ